MSRMVKVEKIVDQWWDDICSHVNNALLFFDDGAAECLHWHGGLNRVLQAGAIDARHLAIFENVGPVYKKAVFVVSTPITYELFQTILTIIKGSSFKTCIVISGLPSKCHESAIVTGDIMFLNFEHEMLSAMGSANNSAKILHIPVFASCLLPELFIFPSISKYFFPVSTGFFIHESQKVIGTDASSRLLSDSLQAGIKTLAICFQTLFDSLELKTDIFSLGRLSQFLANEIENLSQQSRRRGYSSKASVLLIDRSLDLAGPFTQGVETIIGKMLRVLEHLPGHVSDVSINMEELANCSSRKVFDSALLAPGCIAHKNSSSEIDTVDDFFTKKSKEAVIEINRKIAQIGVSKGIAFDANKLNIQNSLKKNILLCKGKSDLLEKHLGLLQQALGVIETLEHPQRNYMESLLATEKLLMQNLSSSHESTCDDIIHLISSTTERKYKLIDVLTLTAFLYALTDANTMKDMTEPIQASLMEVLLQNDLDREVKNKIVGNDSTDDEILMAVKRLFYVLEQLGSVRESAKKYRLLFDADDSALPASYKPLLKQVMEDVFNAADLPDLEFHSLGLKDYIKSSISLFMSVKKSLPKDNPLIIIFVLGGITANEIKMIYDIALHQEMYQVLIGSSQLLTPTDTINDLFKLVREMPS